jgi:hypothetical protein
MPIFCAFPIVSTLNNRDCRVCFSTTRPSQADLVLVRVSFFQVFPCPSSNSRADSCNVTTAAFASNDMAGNEVRVREGKKPEAPQQGRGSNNAVRQMDPKKPPQPNVQVDVRSAATIVQSSFNARKSDEITRRTHAKSMDAHLVEHGGRTKNNAGSDTAAAPKSSSISKMLMCFPTCYLSRSTLKNCLGVFSSRKSKQNQVSKSMPKIKKSRPRSILITPQRRYERERQSGQLKKKRGRVHFFMPRSRSIFSLRIVEPSNKAVRRWLAFMLLPLVYESWTFPFRLALAEPSLYSSLFVMDVIVDFLMVVRVCVCVCVCVCAYHMHVYTA